MKTIVVYFDPKGIVLGQRGVYRAILKSRPGIWDAGKTQDEAVTKLLATASVVGYSGDISNYTVEYRR